MDAITVASFFGSLTALLSSVWLVAFCLERRRRLKATMGCLTVLWSLTMAGAAAELAHRPTRKNTVRELESLVTTKPTPEDEAAAKGILFERHLTRVLERKLSNGSL